MIGVFGAQTGAAIRRFFDGSVPLWLYATLAVAMIICAVLAYRDWRNRRY
jgi:hypothetical protein